MKRIALICPAVTGHLNPMTTLGREFQRRGYGITLIGLPDAEPKARAAGLDFEPFGAAEFPIGALAKASAELGELEGAAALRHTIEHFGREAAVLLRDVPAILRRIGADALLLDQTQPGITAAEIVGIPCVTVCCALALNPEPDVPPWTTAWPYAATQEGRARNEAGYAFGGQVIQPVLDGVNAFRRSQGMPDLTPWTTRERSGDSPLATIAQQPAFFDFPRTDLPPTFHYTGPFHDPAPPAAPDPAFPFERLEEGRPLIYASMGTLQNKLLGVFRTIAEACARIDAQLVLSLGRRDASVTALADDLPGSPLVVPYAPQVELLRRATLTITHAGLNTVLESLTQGVPLVALPITNDQPGVAARLKYIEAGEFVPLAELSAERLRQAVEQVLTEPVYRQAAQTARAEIAKVNGVQRAADIAERAITTGQPVLRS